MHTGERAGAVQALAAQRPPTTLRAVTSDRACSLAGGLARPAQAKRGPARAEQPFRMLFCCHTLSPVALCLTLCVSPFGLACYALWTSFVRRTDGEITPGPPHVLPNFQICIVFGNLAGHLSGPGSPGRDAATAHVRSMYRHVNARVDARTAIAFRGRTLACSMPAAFCLPHSCADRSARIYFAEANASGTGGTERRADAPIACSAPTDAPAGLSIVIQAVN